MNNTNNLDVFVICFGLFVLRTVQKYHEEEGTDRARHTLVGFQLCAARTLQQTDPRLITDTKNPPLSLPWLPCPLYLPALFVSNSDRPHRRRHPDPH